MMATAPTLWARTRPSTVQPLTAGTFDSNAKTLTATFTATGGVTQVTNGTVAGSISVKGAAGNTSTTTAGIANETIDTIAPVLSTTAPPTTNGNQLVLTYNEDGSGLNSNSLAKGDFTVANNNGQSDSVQSVSSDPSGKTVTLALQKAVAFADATVKVSYTPNNLSQEGAQRTQNLVFPVTLRPIHTFIDVDGTPVPLEAGMAVTAEIRTGSRKILEYVFSPIAKVVLKP